MDESLYVTHDVYVYYLECELRKFILHTRKRDSDGERRCTLLERIYVLFCQLFAVRERNQTQFELLSEVFDLM